MFYRIFLFFCLINPAFSASGNLFDITGTGEPVQVSVTLCLNATGKMPFSCQNYIVQNSIFSIKTTIPNHVYAYAGLRINTPGVTLSSPQNTQSNCISGFTCIPLSMENNTIFTFSSTSPPQTIKTVWVGTGAGDVKYSIDDGASWITTETQPDGSGVNSVFVTPSTLYAGTQNGNVEVSTDGGKTWTATTKPDLSPVLSIFVDGNTLYAGTRAGHVEVSTNGGTSWTATPIDPQQGYPVQSVFVKGGVIYVGSQYGNVYTSNDQGATTWTDRGTPYGGAVVTSIYIVNDQLWYAASERYNNISLSKTLDQGATSWTQPPAQPENGAVTTNSVFVWENTTLYVAMSNGEFRQ